MLSWVTDYQEVLRDLGVEEEQIAFSNSKDCGTVLMTEKYISRVESTLTTWFTNILEVMMPNDMLLPYPQSEGQIFLCMVKLAARVLYTKCR